MPSHTKRPFPLTPDKTHPWLGVHAPDPMRDGSSPNSTVGLQSPEGPGLNKGSPQTQFADGGLIQGPEVRRPATDQAAPVVTPLPSPGSAFGRPPAFAKGGKVKDKKNPKLDPEDLGTGLAADAATDLTGRALQVENQIRAAEGLPPLKSKQ